MMSEFIKNLDVTFEIVSPITDIDFTISAPEVPVQQVQQPVQQQRVFEREEQTAFSFDLPLFKQEPIKREPVVEDNRVLFELTNETRDIKVNDPVQFVPVTEVSDNGIGINDKDKENIFEMYFGTNKNKGSGLGLYIVKEAVENIQGNISVSSEINFGSKFTIAIPTFYGT